jgi:hypothetical protein
MLVTVVPSRSITLIASDPLFVTYAARAAGVGTGAPFVVALALCFLHPAKPGALAAIAHPSAKRRYNGVVRRRSRLVSSLLVRFTLATLATMAALYMAPPARANGRFPKAQAIVTVPGGDGSTVYLRATFGILVSHDGGKSFRWLCEQALGFSSTWDPPVAVTRDARLWIALANGLRVTRDGCDVSTVPALDGELVADLTTDATGERVYLVTSTPGKPAFVWRSARAGGDAFERLGAGISGTRFDTIEVAPSKPARLYLTGVPEGQGTRAHLFRSDDGGATIRELKPALPNDGRLFVSAVDPKDPDRVLVRQLSDKGSDVLVSTDGGATFKLALHMAGGMYGFTRTEDGATYYAGCGDPKEGIWRSNDRGEHWEAAAKASVFCLHASGDRLLTCSNPYTPGGYAIAASTDRGATVKALATFDEVTGPIACDAGAGLKCATPWPETRAMIATSAQMPPPTVDTLPSDAMASDASALSPASSAEKPAARSTCGCRIAGDPAPARNTSHALFASLLVVLARRRRTGSRAPQVYP